MACSDVGLEGPYPLPPSTVLVGPYSARPAQALPSDLEEFVSSNPNGFIYVSPGSTFEFPPALTKVCIAEGVGT